MPNIPLHMVLSNVTSSSQVYDNPRVGPYELLDTLGRGNFGKVRRARHLVTAHPYAVKIVDTDVLRQNLPGNLDIRREMSILRGLQHPNIVFLHEVMVSRSRVYMVMDLAPGGDFFQLIRRCGRLPDIYARKYFRQLVDAVSYCHDHGVYHRDLKPENMLLTASEPGPHADLKVTDFGFSAMKDHGGSLLRTNCGSPHYCAPEVWNGSSNAFGYDGAKADAFSIGVILYVLLSGGQPFYDVDEDKLLKKVDRCDVHYPQCMSLDAVDLLSKLLVRDPQKRWSLKMVKRHAWYLATSIDEIVPVDVVGADGSDASDDEVPTAAAANSQNGEEGEQIEGDTQGGTDRGRRDSRVLDGLQVEDRHRLCNGTGWQSPRQPQPQPQGRIETNVTSSESDADSDVNDEPVDILMDNHSLEHHHYVQQRHQREQQQDVYVAIHHPYHHHNQRHSHPHPHPHSTCSSPVDPITTVTPRSLYHHDNAHNNDKAIDVHNISSSSSPSHEHEHEHVHVDLQPQPQLTHGPHHIPFLHGATNATASQPQYTQANSNASTAPTEDSVSVGQQSQLPHHHHLHLHHQAAQRYEHDADDEQLDENHSQRRRCTLCSDYHRHHHHRHRQYCAHSRSLVCCIHKGEHGHGHGGGGGGEWTGVEQEQEEELQQQHVGVEMGNTNTINNGNERKNNKNNVTNTDVIDHYDLTLNMHQLPL